MSGEYNTFDVEDPKFKYDLSSTVESKFDDERLRLVDYTYSYNISGWCYEVKELGTGESDTISKNKIESDYRYIPRCPCCGLVGKGCQHIGFRKGESRSE